MELRFIYQHEQIGLRLDKRPALFIGSQVEGKIATVLGWTGKTKGLSERFMVLLVLLAIARKLPAEVNQRLSIFSDEGGGIRLLDLRRLSPFAGTLSCDITKRDICNHFYTAEGGRGSLVTIQPGNRGSHGNDLIRIACAPEEIYIESSQQILDWIVKFTSAIDTKSGSSSELLPSYTVLRPDWQVNPELSSSGFCPRRPIDNPRLFFGRIYEVRSVLSWLTRMPLQNPAILGSRLSGKTSLLRQIYHINAGALLRSDQQSDLPSIVPRLSVVYADFEIPQLQNQLGLQFHILSGLGIETPKHCQLEQFIEILSTKIQTPTVIMMDNISTAMRENSQKSDLHALSDMFWDSMRSLVSNYTNGKLAFLVSAREATETLAVRYHYSSSFFNIFRPLQLGPLSDEASASIIENSPVPFSELDKAWILEVSNGWPGLIQIACDHCLEATHQSIPAHTWQTAALREIKAASRASLGNADV